MTKYNYEELAREIERIAKNAGKIILNKDELLIEEKTDATNIVTNMDIKSQKYIVEECRKLIPDSSFFAEEEGLQELSDEYTWVIDPIDGTTNYAYDFHHSCISIALLYKKQGIIGVVYNPYLDECFVGIEGKQSTCNGKEISVSNNDAKHAIVFFGTSPYNKQLADVTFDLAKKVFIHCRDVRRSGSAALDLCYVASGKVDAYYEMELSPWDYAAGRIIALNAGAMGIALNKETFDYSKKIGVYFANPVCFEEIREIVEGIYE